jgi:glycine/D-amino acid oxidase-like deaminating enzyme
MTGSERGPARPVDQKVLIVGAGIAGLTAAVALDRVGIKVEVVERATALTQAGTALSLWPNALAALDHIGLGPAVAGIGVEEPAGIGCRPSGEQIFQLDHSTELVQTPRCSLSAGRNLSRIPAWRLAAGLGRCHPMFSVSSAISDVDVISPVLETS